MSRVAEWFAPSPASLGTVWPAAERAAERGHPQVVHVHRDGAPCEAGCLGLVAR